jgi:hypothetical protein
MKHITFIVILAFSASLAIAEEEATDKGPLSKAAGYMKRLIPITLSGSRLSLDQDWEKNKETPEEAEEKKKKMAAQMGVTVEQLGRFGMNSTPPGDVFQDVMNVAGGGYYGSGMSSSGNRHSWNAERGIVSGTLTVDTTQKLYDLKLSEKSGRAITVNEEKGLGLSINYTDAAHETGFVFLQAPTGPACLAGYRGKESIALSGDNFIQLLRKEPRKMQEMFLKPLSRLGIDLPCRREHPAVKAMASNGFNKSSPEIAAKVDALIAKLNNDDMDTREQATKDLTALYPKAIFQISKAMDEAQDAELKSRLEVIAGDYPLMVLAREFVVIEKLHEDRAYLLDLLADPEYKAGAHARLTELYGKDYGDDRAAWPKN